MRTIRFDPLPGCIPYRNLRSMRVRAKHAGLSLIDFLAQLHPPVAQTDWKRWIANAEITLDGHRVAEDLRVVAGQRFMHAMPGYVEPEVRATAGILYEDEALLVIDKPAPMPVHPSGRFNRNTLIRLLEPHFPDDKLRIAHRLDANTTGVVVLCRTPEAAASIQTQFERKQVDKRYLARVIGRVPFDQWTCDLRIEHAHRTGEVDTGGARVVSENGQDATTRFECLHRFGDDTSLLRATPITGRTNQIRVHAAQMGFPIVGDRQYGPPSCSPSCSPSVSPSCSPSVSPSSGVGHEHGSGEPPTLSVDQAPMCLHAWQITLEHPVSRKLIRLESPAPPWVGDEPKRDWPKPDVWSQ